MTMLEDLWYGNIIPFEEFLNDNEKLKELSPIMAKDRENVAENLSPKQTEWLEKYDAVMGEMHSESELQAFKYSFRLATALLIESTT